MLIYWLPFEKTIFELGSRAGEFVFYAKTQKLYPGAKNLGN